MLKRQILDDALVVSETSLAFAPKNKFHVNSWQMFDEFIDYSINLFTATVLSLVENGFIKISEKEIKVFKPFGMRLYSQKKYIVQLTKKPCDDSVVGWVEEVLFEQIPSSGNCYFDSLVYEALNVIFNGDTNLTNPGKVLIQEILKNQRIKLYEYNINENRISNAVSFGYTSNTNNNVKPRLFKLSDFNSEIRQTKKIKRLISSQLLKFKHID